MRRHAFSALRGAAGTGSLALVLLLAPAGCGQAEKPPGEAPSADTKEKDKKKTFEMPKTLDEKGESQFAADVWVQGDGVKRELRESYLADDKIAGGALAGLCYIVYEKPGVFPSKLPLTAEPEKLIQNPEAGELDYFRLHRPMQRFDTWPYMKRDVGAKGGEGSAAEQAMKQWGGAKEGGNAPESTGVYGVNGAVLIIEGVEAGKRPPLAPATLLVNYLTRELERYEGQPTGEGNIAIHPVGRRLYLGTTETLTCHFELRREGSDKVIFDCAVPAYNDKAHAGLPYGATRDMKAPDAVPTPALNEPGVYIVTCRRHAWQRACVHVVKNPYVALSYGRYGVRDEGGKFSIADVPPGEYSATAWHPSIEPAQRSFKITIEAGKTITRAIEFKAPASLKNPPPVPSKIIEEWAFAGPFPNVDNEGIKKSFPPEQALDLNARYKGRDGAEVRWKNVKSNPHNGLALRNKELIGEDSDLSTSYFTTTLKAAAAQDAFFELTGEGYFKVWLNGTPVFESLPGAMAAPQILYGKLKAGANTLLVKLAHGTSSRGGSMWLKSSATDTVAAPPPLAGN